MWSGSIDPPPLGWAICDGQNGTPNLLGKFILGANDTYKLGTPGGNASIKLTPGQLPNHSHNLEYGHGAHGLESWKASIGVATAIGGAGGSRSGFANTSACTNCGGAPIDILPPYYALAYIMKL